MKKLSPTKTSVETLLLRPVKDSAGHFCCRLSYSKKSFPVSDESPSDPDLNIKQHSSSKETAAKHFCCNVCGVKYCRRAKLVTHMRIHTGETPYTCRLCGKQFRRSDYLTLHIKSHTGEKRRRTKRFVCEHCGMKFCTSALLKYHLLKEAGERPYACTLCEKTFYSEIILRQHKNNCHSDERAFCCFLCGQSFMRLHTLQKHTRIHTGERPYSCSECGKTFPYQYSLLMHNKLHSGRG